MTEVNDSDKAANAAANTAAADVTANTAAVDAAATNTATADATANTAAVDAAANTAAVAAATNTATADATANTAAADATANTAAADATANTAAADATANTAAADATANTAAADAAANFGVVGVICGSGEYPRQVVQSCINKGIDCCAVFINNDDGEVFKTVPYVKAKIGEIGTAINFLHSRNVKKVVFAGAVKRPNFSELPLDSKGIIWLLKLGKAIFAGDDALLKEIANLLQQEGFEVIAGTDLIGKETVFVTKETSSQKQPTDNERADIKKGFEVAKALGKLDIGQSVIICDGIILGVECIEGTDELISRCAALRKSESGGVLVKTSKPQQDQRMDLPTVGLDTLANLHKYRFSGLAIENDRCIVLEKDAFMEKCNELSLFFLGIDGKNGGQ